MTPSDAKSANICLDYLTNIYQSTTIETKDPQPLYILHRDAIRTFLHEKVGLLGLEAKILGVLGVEGSLIAALGTATFHDLWFVKAHVVEAAFYLASLGVACRLVVLLAIWWRTREQRTVDALSDQLGQRGSKIRPTQPNGQQAAETSMATQRAQKRVTKAI